MSGAAADWANFDDGAASEQQGGGDGSGGAPQAPPGYEAMPQLGMDEDEDEEPDPESEVLPPPANDGRGSAAGAGAHGSAGGGGGGGGAAAAASAGAGAGGGGGTGDRADALVSVLEADYARVLALGSVPSSSAAAGSGGGGGGGGGGASAAAVPPAAAALEPVSAEECDLDAPLEQPLVDGPARDIALGDTAKIKKIAAGLTLPPGFKAPAWAAKLDAALEAKGHVGGGGAQ